MRGYARQRHHFIEGSTNSLDVEERLSTMETILDFMELKDDEKIICAAYVLRK